MSQYYNPKRKASWNYGGASWKLSRSKIDLFLECQRCFYVDNKLGTKRPPGFPFNLNSAVDLLLKKEFDTYRKKKEPHPLMVESGVKAVPYSHSDLDIWRENFKGITCFHKPTGMTISGAVDDVWRDDTSEELIIVDYKATSKDEEVTLDADWQIGYKRQMEIYQWLFRQNGFSVSNTGYFVYANGKRDRDSFDARLDFDIKLIPYMGNDDWIEHVLMDIHKTLESEEIPTPGEECDYCPYREVVGKTLWEHSRNTKSVTKPRERKKVKKNTENDPITSPTLF
jgi:CRISPR/Cas system-associated exonuclease Cas4 (RecB family)